MKAGIQILYTSKILPYMKILTGNTQAYKNTLNIVVANDMIGNRMYA